MLAATRAISNVLVPKLMDARTPRHNKGYVHGHGTNAHPNYRLILMAITIACVAYMSTNSNAVYVVVNGQ
jgi:hypothetical protein